MYDLQIVRLLAFGSLLCFSKGLVLEAAEHRVVLLALGKSEVRGTGRFGEGESFSVTNTNPSPSTTKTRHALLL